MWQEHMAAGAIVPTLVGAGLIALGLVALVLSTPVYKHIICMRYLFAGWKAVVPMVSALPAALGVFLLILVFAIMDGFALETREMTRGTLSDIIVDAHMEGMPYYDDFIKRVMAIPGVEAATPIIQTYAVVRVKPHRKEFYRVEDVIKPTVRDCIVIGIRPGEKAKMGRFEQYLVREMLRKKLTAEMNEAVGLLGEKSPAKDDLRKALRETIRDIDKGYLAALCSVEESMRSIAMATDCVDYLEKDLAPPAELARRTADNLRALGGDIKCGRPSPEHLLDVPAPLRRLNAPARAGCIAGVGVIGTPKAERATETVELGAGRKVLAGFLAAAAAVAALIIWQTARRHSSRVGWRIAFAVALVAAAGLAVVAVAAPVTETEIERSQVVDFPLIDYGGDLVVSTIPVRESGAIDTEVGGVPKAVSKALTLVDSFKSGYWEADSKHVYVDFHTAQQMAGMEGQPAGPEGPAVPARASQIHVKIANPAQGELLVGRIRQAWEAFVKERPEIGIRQLIINTWETQQRLILTVVEVERNVTALMLGAMFLGFGVLIGLISYVMAFIKSRDVGILKALGARDAGVGSLFLGYGFIIGVIGMAVGMTAALLMIHYLDPIEIWVNQTLGIDVFPREMYYFDHIPRHVSAPWCIAVGGAVLALSTLASMAGGLLAALKQPVETLRYE
jgi:ABC-type lipoprotein release transport system permease subunit